MNDISFVTKSKSDIRSSYVHKTMNLIYDLWLYMIDARATKNAKTPAYNSLHIHIWANNTSQLNPIETY